MLLMELPERMQLHLAIIYLLHEYLLLFVPVVDMINHYLMDDFVRNEQEILYHMYIDLKRIQRNVNIHKKTQN
jgi:hypothetical protein